MMNHVPLLAGALIGLTVAVPIGPMGLLCIQRTLASGMGVGISTGLGAVTVNVVYGAAILLGMDRVAPLLASGGRMLSAAGGLVLLWSAARTLLRARRGNVAAVSPALSPRAAYASAVLFNASNPMGPILLLALLAPVGAHPPGLPAAAALLAGLAAAAMAWWVTLSIGVATLRARLSPALLGHVNQTAGLVLTVYGAMVLVRAVHP